MDLYKIAASGLKGIGKKTLTKLCAKTNGLKALFEEDIISLSERCNIKKELLTNMNRNKALALAEKQLIFTKRYGIQTLFYEDSGYPALLKECTDAPITLFYKGNAPLNTRTVSIIGTRKATSYGKENVEHIISKFQGQKTIVISGLAYGIDTFVHECCLKYDIPTIGVLGHGLDMIYPRSNRDLAKRMCKNGGLLTEFGINHSISRYCFPKRNRIIAGMSDVTIVVESPEKGGSIITAEIANSYNREVMAIPGSIFSSSSKGCNQLIKNQKAHLMTDSNDLFQLMNWTDSKIQKLPVIELTDQEDQIVQLLKNENEIHFDELIQKTTFSVSNLQSVILNLELKQVLQSLPGARFSLNHKTYS